MQGAREYQEDRSTIIMGQQRMMWVAVHDGHGGDRAVDRLVRWMDARKDVFLHRTRLMPWVHNMAQDPRCRFMAKVYYEAIKELADETSGVVSVSALCTEQAIYLAWVGDCQGCVLGGDTAEQIDYAEAPSSPPVHKDKAMTTPHCFMSEPAAAHSHDIPLYCDVERFVTLERQENVHFAAADAASQDELDRLKRHKPADGVRLDSTVLLMGHARLLVDARVSHSIQPTRALGDGQDHRVLRHPTVMRVPLSHATSGVLLCSDGAFNRGAFENMQAVCDCVRDPLHFIRHHLYRRGQEITERLIVAKLYDGLLTSLAMLSSWDSVIYFLRYRHLVALKTNAFYATFVDYYHTPAEAYSSKKKLAWWWCRYNAAHGHWARVCSQAIEWLAYHGPTAPGAQVAAYLAVIMGSTDNVTVLVARVAPAAAKPHARPEAALDA